MSKPPKITIIGAGLAGSLLAIYLAKKGFKVEVYERRPDMRKVKIPAGRSINLALSTRGIYALKEVGLDKAILKMAIPMRGRMIHNQDGQLTFQPYGRKPHEVINAISRGGLNKKLLDTGESYHVKFYFNCKCLGMDFKTGELTLQNIPNEDIFKIKPEVVLAADGAGSAIRKSMLNIGRFNYSQQYLDHGYKELSIPADVEGLHKIEKHALHIWPRGTYMLIALPNLDGSFTCTLFLPFEGENSFATLNTEEKVQSFFENQFPDAVPLMPTLLEDFFRNPVGNLVTVKCYPWHVNGKALLLGDAAHAIVPFYGQGMNCAFEDCTYLNECIEKYGTNWEKVFQEFEQLRKVNTDAIADLALENFIEMRDKVADPRFILKKKASLALEEKYPSVFIPKYSMVTFHRLPYAEAKAKGEIQENILDELCKNIDSLDELDWQKADRLIREKWLPVLEVSHFNK